MILRRPQRLKLNRLYDKNKIFLILFAGILIRTLYVIFMPVVNFAQYDMGTVDFGNNVLTGHLGYIFWLVKYHAVPSFDPRLIYQFNHPPVHHALCALWVSFIGLFTDNSKTLIESVQFITLIYSVITLFAFERILEETKVSENGKILALLIFTFQPTIVMTAGSVNNDGAGLMFQMLAIWFALRFYRTKAYRDIIGIALFIGIGMLSKLSAGLIAVPIGVLFVYVLVKESIDDKKFALKRFMQYTVFGVICFPLGLFWVLRCFFKFGMPFTYIAFLPETSWQYVGMYSAFERLFLPNPVTLIENISNGSIGMGWNIWVQLFRTSALGECDMALFPLLIKLICFLMMAVNFVMALWAFIAFIRTYAGFKNKNTAVNAGTRIIWILSWIIMMYSYFSFANKYPHECSMNFRYVQFAMVPPMVAVAVAEGENGRFKNLKNIAVAIYSILSTAVLICWCLVA